MQERERKEIAAVQRWREREWGGGEALEVGNCALSRPAE